VYIEPHVPLRRLIVVGDTAVADAVARVGAQIPFDVLRVVDAGGARRAQRGPRRACDAIGALGGQLDAERRAGRTGLIAVVASQGHYDGGRRSKRCWQPAPRSSDSSPAGGARPRSLPCSRAAASRPSGSRRFAHRPAST